MSNEREVSIGLPQGLISEPVLIDVLINSPEKNGNSTTTGSGEDSKEWWGCGRGRRHIRNRTVVKTSVDFITSMSNLVFCIFREYFTEDKYKIRWG